MQQHTTFIRELLPTLTKTMRKGDCGKIGVIGGSAEYTGAPYFSAITPMKIGADLAFVYTHPAAAPVIKGYSPELIVYPSNDFEANRASIEKLDALVFGPGLGREEHTVQLLQQVIQFAKARPKICVVIDADGLFYIKDCLKELSGCRNVIITPNHREFARLFGHVFPGQPVEEAQLGEQTRTLAKRLGIVVIRKGEQDLVSDGQELLVCEAETSMRRCGGQGDILSGAIALFTFWAKRKDIDSQNEGNEPSKHSEQYTTRHLMHGAMAASQLVRRASLMAFQRTGRSMLASDVLANLPRAIQAFEPFPSISRHLRTDI